MSYRQTGSASSWLRNLLDIRLVGFSNQEVIRQSPPNAACSLGPRPGPSQPRRKCGTGPHDPTTAIAAYKSIHLMTEAAKKDPTTPASVQLTCASTFPTDRSCTITWDAVDSTGFGDYPVYWVYLFADLERSDTCTTRSIQRNHWQQYRSLLTRSIDVNLAAPDDLPSGCTVKEWAAAVHVEIGVNSSSSEVAYHPLDSLPSE